MNRLRIGRIFIPGGRRLEPELVENIRTVVEAHRARCLRNGVDLVIERRLRQLPVDKLAFLGVHSQRAEIYKTVLKDEARELLIFDLRKIGRTFSGLERRIHFRVRSGASSRGYLQLDVNLWVLFVPQVHGLIDAGNPRPERQICRAGAA